MTNREQALISMFIAIEKELDVDKTHWDSNALFKKEALLFLAAWVLCKTAAEKAHIDNSGFSQEKLDQKTKLSKLTSKDAGKAYVTFINADKPSLADQLFTEYTDYFQKADAECAILAQAAHDLMSVNISLLDPDTLTPADLDALQEEITKFIAIKGTSEIVHEVSPELTQQFKDSFAPVLMREDHLKLLIRDFEETDNEFYTRFLASCKMPTVNVHHTYVEGNLKGKVSGNPLLGVVFTLTKGKKSGTTDKDGNFLIEEVKAGKDTITGVLDGVVIYTADITIKRGRTNHYDIIVEGK
jgi:hypothetical protein